MKIYLAGNFPQMRTIETELQIMNWVTRKSDYCRLISFHYMKGWSENVIYAAFRHAITTRHEARKEYDQNLKEEEKNESQ